MLMFSYAIKKKDEIERVAKANRWVREKSLWWLSFIACFMITSFICFSSQWILWYDLELLFRWLSVLMLCMFSQLFGDEIILASFRRWHVYVFLLLTSFWFPFWSLEQMDRWSNTSNMFVFLLPKCMSVIECV